MNVTLDAVRVAAELIVLSQYAVPEMLVNRMGITRSEAGALMNHLENLGVISPPDDRGVYHVRVRPSAVSTMLRNIADGQLAAGNPLFPEADETVHLQAEKLIFHALPTTLTRGEASACARTIANRLIRTGWRPSAPVAR